MQNLTIEIDINDDATVLVVTVTGSGVPEGILRELSDWAVSMETGIDMEALTGLEWQVSEPEEVDRGWSTTYHREA